MRKLVSLLIVTLIVPAAMLGLPADARAVTMDWRTIGNPGNAPDTSVTMITDFTTGYGAVDYSYKIGTYDVNNSQYTEFLNAKDPTGANTLNLWNSGMQTDVL